MNPSRKSLLDRSIAMVAWMVLVAGIAVRAVAAVPAPPHGDPHWFDVLDLHGTPASPTDRSFNIFFDAGAWQGYSLPATGDAGTGFSGPFVHSLGMGRWAGLRFAELQLRDATSGRAIALVLTGAHAAPGYLVRSFAGDRLGVTETLFFADSWHAVVRIDLTSARARAIHLSVAGTTLPGEDARLAIDHAGIVQTFIDSHSRLTTRIHSDGGNASRPTLSPDGYRIELVHPLHLEPDLVTTVVVVQALSYDGRNIPPLVDAAAAWRRNRARWAGYLKYAASSHLPGLPDAIARRVAVKAILTLVGNWRAARGDLRHDGVVPSYSNPDFNGFWSWDSWKQAAAMAAFAPALAESQIRATFDDQAPDGMVPDVTYLDASDDNWRDTKPPLAAWAVMEVFDATHDEAFLREMYPKLVRFQQWWFKDRDHAHDGLAEYGSTDGSAIAAKWESGMDNAVRFDSIGMLRNGEHAWSMNQEAVDLNAYLYLGYVDLARMARVLGKTGDRAKWLADAARMKHAIRARMFDADAGYFFDRKIPRGGFINVYGPEGWSPLWVGIATDAQAASVAKIMLDPKKFATFMPFPSVAADDPHFSPATGYWRGPVWLDQAYFGVRALARYGRSGEADELARRLVLHAAGLTGDAPIYENYDPLNGRRYQSRNFSWSAACYLMLLHPPQH